MKLQTETLGQIVGRGRGLIQTGPFGSQLHEHEYADEGIPVVMPKDIIEGTIDERTVARIPEGVAARLQRHRVEAGELILPRRGEITKRALVRSDQEGWICGTGCLKIAVASTEVTPEFLFYFLELPHVVQWLEQNAVGTTMLNLSAAIVEKLPITYPAREYQKRISAALLAYDELIENNRRRMALLEEAARQLYREWFVRLRFPGHEHTPLTNGLPQGWARKPLGEIAPLNYGKALKEEDRVAGGVPVYGSSGVVGMHDASLVKERGIIVGRKGNVGSVFWSDRPFWPIDTVYFIAPEQSSLFLYHALRLVPFQSSDVAVPGLNRGYAHSIDVILPPIRLRGAFDEIAAPMFLQKANLREQNEKLRAARDLLLPRLMSGEISV